MRVTLLEPRGGYVVDVVRDALSLVMETPPSPGSMRRWAPLELALAYDWAMREHLRAGDVRVMRRPRPAILGGDGGGT